MTVSPPLLTADYLVRIEGDGGVIALDGRSGAVVAHGASASAVMQTAIDRLPREGGKIYLAA
jgi:hypothetical protein